MAQTNRAGASFTAACMPSLLYSNVDEKLLVQGVNCFTFQVYEVYYVP